MTDLASLFGLVKGHDTAYSCIMADPPWEERGGGKITRGAQRHYPLLKTRDIPGVMQRSPMWNPAEDGHLWNFFILPAQIGVSSKEILDQLLPVLEAERAATGVRYRAFPAAWRLHPDGTPVLDGWPMRMDRATEAMGSGSESPAAGSHGRRSAIKMHRSAFEDPIGQGGWHAIRPSPSRQTAPTVPPAKFALPPSFTTRFQTWRTSSVIKSSFGTVANPWSNAHLSA